MIKVAQMFDPKDCVDPTAGLVWLMVREEKAMRLNRTSELKFRTCRL